MDISRIRQDFPLLSSEPEANPLVYFDSACQSLRPTRVLEAMNEYYGAFPSCAGRSVHRLATEVSIRCDDARSKVARFFGAGNANEIAFLKNATEGLNTVILGYGFEPGDEVVTTDYEHNSLQVPVFKVCGSKGVKHIPVPSSDDATFDIEAFHERMSKRVKLVAMCLTSNVHGYTLPARDVVDIAHSYGARVLFDAAQAAPSMPLDLGALEVDYLAASAHKMLGPSGVGILYVNEGAVADIEPIMYGGHGVAEVRDGRFTLLPPPERFETGLQNYSGILGTGAAVDYLNSVGMDEIRSHEAGLNRRMTRGLMQTPGIAIMKPLDPNMRGGIFSFNIDGMTPHDIAMILDNSKNIMIRSGMHCCHSYFDEIAVDGCARASVYIYNSYDEVDFFIEAVRDLSAGFSRVR